MKTLRIEKLICLTSANFKVQVNGRTLLIPVGFVQGVNGNVFTFHNKRDLMTIFKMI